MSNTLSKLELANMVFDDELKNIVSTTLINHYGVANVEYKQLSCGIGISIKGSDSFRFILSAIGKITGIPTDAFGVLEENKNAKTAFYAYLPEKDKALSRKLKLCGKS